jgi:DNA-binding transcriptional LysR family regulator
MPAATRPLHRRGSRGLKERRGQLLGRIGIGRPEQDRDALRRVLGETHTMLARVQSGIGVALIPQAALRLHFEGTVMRRFQTDPPKPAVTLCSFRRDNDNPSLNVLKEAVLERFRSLKS